MHKTLVFFIYLLRTSIKGSISKRGSFLIQASLIVINNLIFYSIWWIFFSEFQDVGGWNFNDMVMLMAIGTGGYGLMQICFGGIRNLSIIIQSGDLDSFMTQPKNILAHIAGSKSLAKGWGQLIILGGITSIYVIFLILIGVLSSCLVFTSVNIIAHSLSFWMGEIEGVSKKYCDSLFLFSLYPTNIYSGILQIILFTVVPAGVISYLPVELIRNFSWIKLFFLIGTSISFSVLAFAIFYLGLKRYESGNKFGIRL